MKTNIKSLNNKELESSFLNLVKREREILHLVLLHTREVDIRKLYLERGCSSLFKYMTQVLRYSAPSAQRRIEAMRLMKSVPELVGKIQSGSINLSQVEVISRAVKQKEKECKISLSSEDKIELIALVENKDVSSAQQIVAKALDIALKPIETKTIQKDESVHLSITLSKEQYEKLIACKDLAAHLLLQRNTLAIADVIEVLADKFIESKTAKTSASDRKPSASKVAACSSANEGPQIIGQEHTSKENRTLTPKTRKEILGQQKSCQFKDPITQQICGSRFALEIDHKQSQWAGGNHSPENLQVLCAGHNKLKYHQEAQLRFR